MRITSARETIVIVDDLEGLVCNCCGKLFKPEQSDLVQHFDLHFGYHSKFDNKGNWKGEICENCYVAFIKTFKIVPENFMSDPDYISDYDKDHNLHQELFDNWKETDEWPEDENTDCFYSFEENYEETENTETLQPTNSPILKIIK